MTSEKTKYDSGNYQSEKSRLLVQEDSTIIENHNDGRRSDQDENRMEEPQQQSTLFVWCLTSFAAIGGFLFGYDTGVVSGAMLLIRDRFSLSPFKQELVVSVTIGTAFVAALIGGTLNDMFGRRIIILLASLVFTAGAIILGIAQNLTMLVAGRAVLGLGIGFASMTVPVYIAESAPVRLRGRLVTVNNLFITGGQCVASFVDAGFSYLEHDGWRYMLALAGAPSVIQFIGFLFLPESPRWLMRKGRKDEARKVLQSIRGTIHVDNEMKEIQTTLDEDERSDSSANSMVILRILKTPPVRRAVIVGCGLQLFQQLCGINTVMYYSASIISMSGVNDQHEAILLAAVMATVNFVFTFVGLWLVERIGRKKLLMTSLLGSGLSLALSAIAFQLAATHSPAVTQLPPASYNTSHCSTYRWCEDCIENSDCGFCYRTVNGSIQGSCLSTDPDKNTHSSYGPCANTSLPDGVTWAPDYCPNPFWWMSILGMILYLVFFAPGMGPMPWTINSEIYPLWARSTGNSLSAATNWMANIVVSMSFLTLTNTLTKYGTYWLYFGFTVIGLLFCAIYLPETKGTKLEDVEELFQDPWCSCFSSSSTSRGELKFKKVSPRRYTSFNNK